MSEAPTLPSYEEVAQALEKIPSDVKPAEVHGLLCGILSSTSGKLDQQWENLILLPKIPKSLRPLLQSLAVISQELMESFSFEFNLYLPDDEVDINERTEALGLWCQGFLIGLQQGIQFKDKTFSAEVMEALNDLTEISQVNYGDLNSTEEDENAFYDLVEYVRMSALLLYQEFKALIPQGTTGSSLH